jgi:glycosyltransferase involved in cell wall biosynthesis
MGGQGPAVERKEETKRMSHVGIQASQSDAASEVLDLGIIIPFLEKYGGAERYLIECVRYWQEKHRITLYASSLNEDLLAEHGIGDKVKRVVIREYFTGEHSVLLNALLLPKIWREEVGRHDLYHAHLWPTHLIDLHPMVWFPHEPLRMLHDLSYEQPLEEVARGAGRLIHIYPKYHYDYADQHLARAYLAAIDATDQASKPDRIVANSMYTARYLEDVYKVPVKDVVYPGVEPGLFTDLPVDPNLFVTISQLWLHKRIHLLIEAIALTDDTQLAVVGSGPEQERLQNLCRKLGIEDRVFFLSGLTNKELSLLLSRACAFLFAAIREPFGIVLLEAMAAGKPVIAVNEGGYVEVCDPGFSFLLPPFPAEFAKRITYLQQHPEVARKMGLEGRKKVTDYTWKRAADQMEGLLLETWSNSLPRTPVRENVEGQRTLFGIQYYLWYGEGFGEAHWNDDPRTGYVDDRPFIGYYRSDKRQTIEYHLDLLSGMGMDYVILNLHIEENGANCRELKGIRNVFEITRKINSSLRFAVQLVPHCEDFSRIEDVLKMIRSDFFGHPNYLHMDDEPVLFWFWSGAYDADRGLFSVISGTVAPVKNIAASLRLLSETDEQKLTFGFFDGFTLFSPLELTEENHWSRVWASAYSAAEKAGMPYRVATVSPGYDDRNLRDELRARNPYRSVDRKQGSTYRTCMEFVEKLEEQPHLVVISTFNEFHEHTHIEPTLRHGELYVDMTKEFVERMKRKWGDV